MQDSPWIMLAGSVIPSVAVAIWTVIQWLGARKDKKEERELTIEQKREADLERERKVIAEAHEKIIRDLHEDMDNYRKRLHEKNIERFRAWDRAHWWHGKAWEMRNEAANARQIAESACRIAGQPAPKWDVPIWLPPFDDDLKAPPPSHELDIYSKKSG